MFGLRASEASYVFTYFSACSSIRRPPRNDVYRWLSCYLSRAFVYALYWVALLVSNPASFDYAYFVVSRIRILCHMIRHC